MNLALNFLIESLKNAHNPTDETSDNECSLSFEKQMEAVEEYAERRNIPPTLSQRCGLIAEQFPQVESFTEAELKMVVDAFQDMLCTWNLVADFPSNLPLGASQFGDKVEIKKLTVEAVEILKVASATKNSLFPA